MLLSPLLSLLLSKLIAILTKQPLDLGQEFPEKHCDALFSPLRFRWQFPIQKDNETIPD
jgi:hypothetical protein